MMTWFILWFRWIEGHMNFAEARQQLSHEDMRTLTSKAIADGGPFVIKKISKLGERKEVTVEYSKTNRTKVIILDPYGG